MAITAKARTDLEDALAGLLPSCSNYACLAVSEDLIRDVPGALISAEAVPKRRREFAAGRMAASKALEIAGKEGYFPTVGEARQPVWPVDFVGSITHSDELAIAAVARKSSLKGIGIDLESAHLSDLSIRPHIMTTSELEVWDGRIGADIEANTIAVFSYKESIFKCVYPLTGIFLEFTDVIVEPPMSSPTVKCANPDHPATAIIEKVVGRVVFCSDQILTACWLKNT